MGSERRGVVPKERAVGVLEETGNSLCAPSLHSACTEPREEKDLLLKLPRICLPLWESDVSLHQIGSFGGSFL